MQFDRVDGGVEKSFQLSFRILCDDTLGNICGSWFVELQFSLWTTETNGIKFRRIGAFRNNYLVLHTGMLLSVLTNAFG